MKRIKANQIADGYLSEGIDESINPEYFIADEAQAEIDEAVNIITELREQLKKERDDVIWIDAEDFIQQHKRE